MSFSPVPLFESYYFREATPEEFGPFFQQNRPQVFSDSLTIMIEDWMSSEEKQKQRELSRLVKDSYVLRIFVMKGEEIVGWHVGRQVDVDTFYMGNTGIFPQYQGHGIYTALLPKLLEIFHEKGFQKVISRHNPANSAVLVPKLKAGFVITGMEVDERFGMLVLLSYIFNAKRLKAYKFRTGAIRPDEDIKKFL